MANRTWGSPRLTGDTSSTALYPLTADVSGKFLRTAGGQPFWMQGEGTAQMLFLQDVATQVIPFIADRVSKGFNTFWCHFIANSLDGAPNADGSTRDGIRPFTGTLDGSTVDGGPNYDLTTPNPLYFARVDQILTLCLNAGIVVFADMMENDSYLAVYQNNGNTGMASLAAYLANRYKPYPNIVWMTGNDFQTWNTVPTDNQLAQAVMSTVAGIDQTHLQTTELNFNISGSLDNSLLAPYTTLASAYTYYPTYYEVLQEYNSGVKTVPVYMVEGYYEGVTYGNLTPTSASNLMLRKVPWWTTLSGGLAGYLYGSQYFQFQTGWQAGIDTVAVQHLQYWTAFFTSYPWWRLVPDQTHSVVTAGYGTATGNASGNIQTDNYVTTARVPDGSLVIAYCPASSTITVAMSSLRGTTTARWLDPTNGTYTGIGSYPNTGSQNFTTPGNNSAGDPDWALVLTA